MSKKYQSQSIQNDDDVSKDKRNKRLDPAGEEDYQETDQDHQDYQHTPTGEYDDEDEQFRKLTAKLEFLKAEKERMEQEEKEAAKQKEIQAAKDREMMKNRRRNIIKRFRFYEGRE